jgi:hypothetical protein
MWSSARVRQCSGFLDMKTDRCCSGGMPATSWILLLSLSIASEVGLTFVVKPLAAVWWTKKRARGLTTSGENFKQMTAKAVSEIEFDVALWNLALIVVYSVRINLDDMKVSRCDTLTSFCDTVSGCLVGLGDLTNLLVVMQISILCWL